MTTYDPKYKHKPSEKHTLEEVLKSLQDLIRNDLPEDKSAGSKTGPPSADPSRSEGKPLGRDEQRPHHERSVPLREDFAPSNPAAGPVNLDAVMRSLRDLINNELDVGEQPARVEAQASPASEQQRARENISEDDVTQEAEPTFEDTDELKIEDEAVSSGEQTASVSEPPETGASIAGESEALDEELSFEDTDALNLDEEIIPSEATAPLPDESAADEKLPDELVPLDEELTFEGATESAPSPPAESAIPELPGEISPELLSEPELTVPAVEPAPAKEEITAPGTQQEFFLGEPAPSVVEHVPSSQNLSPEPAFDLEAAPVAVDIPPEVADEAAAENIQGMSGEALPTIDVEETFDESAYLEAEAQQAQSQPSENQEIQNIIASTLVTPAELDMTPPVAAVSAEQSSAQNLTPAAETESETMAAKSELKLEIVDEPATENLQSAPSVDFNTIEFMSPQNESQTSSVTPEAAAPESEPPPALAEPPATAETLEKAVTVTDESPSGEEKVESIPEPEQVQTPDSKISAPPSSDLDDIPVLKEVVAPPAGSALVPEEKFPPAQPRLPAPNRARDIVVRAVAKLNVEMRKSGGAGLDTKTILRLQKLIRQELEKDSEK